MTREETIAYVQAQSVAAMAEIEAMKAANRQREMDNRAPAYCEHEFLSAIEKYGLSHNAILSLYGAAL